MSKVKCSKEIEVMAMPSMCDENSLMSIPDMLDMFQDVAGIHADSVGIGALELEESGLFWIVSKIRLRVFRRPVVQETIDAVTWIQPADRATCERDWSISAKDGETLAYVRSIWAALKRENFKPAHMADFYPDSDFSIAPPDDEPFLDMQFLLQCYEGETIRFVKRPSENALMEVGALNKEGQVCFLAAIK